MPRKGGTLENLKPFKPGQNTKRKKSGKTLRTILQELLDQEFSKINPLTKTRKPENLLLCEWLNISLIAQGLKGNVRALEMIYNRIDGKVPDDINMKIDGSVMMKLIKQKVRSKIDKKNSKDKK